VIRILFLCLALGSCAMGAATAPGSGISARASTEYGWKPVYMPYSPMARGITQAVTFEPGG
jgi:hypothetical protein